MTHRVPLPEAMPPRAAMPHAQTKRVLSRASAPLVAALAMMGVSYAIGCGVSYVLGSRTSTALDESPRVERAPVPEPVVAPVAVAPAPTPPPAPVRRVPPVVARPAPTPVVATMPTECEGDVYVVGSVDTGRPETSSVYLAGADGHLTAAVRVGSPLADGVVTALGWDITRGAYARVEARGRAPCYIAQWSPTATPHPTPAAQAVASNDSSAADPHAQDSDIQQVAPNHYAVHRAVLDRLVADPSRLFQAMHTEPYLQDGHVVGVQLMEATPGSFQGTLGLQSGDVLMRINDQVMDTPDRWLQSYSQMRSADHLSLSLMRNGQPMQIDVDVS